MARRKLHDPYFHRAKAEGYAARSAYKLQQIQESKRLLRPGMRILDLGCSPGSWLQVASDIVGSQGRVVGLDLKPVKLALPPTVSTFEGDIFETPAATLTDAAGGLFHAVLSDMAPNTIGHGDAERSDEICRCVLDLLPKLLMPTGALVMKVLEGTPFPALLKDTRRMFSIVKPLKPKASRDVSSEIFIIAQGYRPAPSHS